MIKHYLLYVIVFAISTATIFSCNKKTSSSVSTTTATNSKESLKKPYLLLISLDGFRWDYVERFKPPHLSKFIQNGVKAESLIPSFPSKTFPNHYTIATGLYPDKHGILGNSFYSHDKQTTYAIRNRETVEDGSFYGGTPIWNHANNANMVTASYFFVGSEADIQGIHPTYYYTFDRNTTREARVAQVLDWLNMSASTRPHMITTYFADMDNIGHSYGPNNDEKLQNSLFRLDSVLGDLFTGIEKLNLPVNIIIVSDHGMMEVPIENYIPIEKIEDDDAYITINNGSIVNIHPIDKAKTDEIFNGLKEKEENFKVYKSEDIPYFETAPTNENWGSINILPDNGYYFIGVRNIEMKKSFSNKLFGQHGFDPEIKDMHGIFYANGPAFKKGYTIPPVKNIHIYPLMCQILGLDIPETIDGDINHISSVLQSE